MSRTVFYTATTLDGFLADETDSLDWLFEHSTGEGGPADYETFIAQVGAVVMGATTYRWVARHLETSGEDWPYAQPSWVFTHNQPAPLGDSVRYVSGAVADHWEAIRDSADGRDVWVVGGGDLAGQFADLGLLDRMIVSVAPVTLGAGRPLFPRRHDLRLVDATTSGDFAVLTYDVVGPRQDGAEGRQD